MNVAALYVDPLGPYLEASRRLRAADYSHAEAARAFGIGVRVWGAPAECFQLDCWDESRDARKYDGPHPVVAHPPCKHWGRLRHLAKDWCPSCEANVRAEQCGDYRWHLECPAIVETDRDCAPRAVEQVRRWGGVLEHPAGSLLWANGVEMQHNGSWYAGLPAPWHPADPWGGYTIEVDQCEWGHVARKRTWLYLVGVPRSALEAPPFPGREPTHWISGGRGRAGKKAKTTPVPPGIKVCSAQQRRRTPPLFAEYLVRLARASRVERQVA